MAEAEILSFSCFKFITLHEEHFNGEWLIKSFGSVFFFILRGTVFGPYTAILSGELTVLDTSPPSAQFPQRDDTLTALSGLS